MYSSPAPPAIPVIYSIVLIYSILLVSMLPSPRYTQPPPPHTHTHTHTAGSDITCKKAFLSGNVCNKVFFYILPKKVQINSAKEHVKFYTYEYNYIKINVCSFMKWCTTYSVLFYDRRVHILFYYISSEL